MWLRHLSHAPTQTGVCMVYIANDHGYYFWITDLRFLKLGIFIFNCSSPGMFLPLDRSLQYWVKYVIIGVLYVKFVFSSGICYRRVRGLKLIGLVVFGATDQPLAPGMLIHLWKSSLNNSLSVRVVLWKTFVPCFPYSGYTYVLTGIVASRDVLIH